MPATDALPEARRLMTICNSCRYCEGLCAVFPAMEMRREFSEGDLTYLANLCHGCGACYIDCQFSPPHEFQVNVPRAFSELRHQSYADSAWPKRAGIFFRWNGVAIGFLIAVSMVSFLAAFRLAGGPAAFYSTHIGAGAFYWLMPHDSMALLFGGVFIAACFALAAEQRSYHQATSPPAGRHTSIVSFLAAAKDASRLRYLDGGGADCYNAKTGRKDRRRLFHHLTFYGFLLCFASTSAATLYHYLLGSEAPYAWYSLPVLLGILGGLGLIAGPIGLLLEKHARDPETAGRGGDGMNAAFLASLLLTSGTGFALLFLRHTSMMSEALAIHLGTVFALFAALPYGKFVHGLYRFAALVRYARERKEFHQPST